MPVPETVKVSLNPVVPLGVNTTIMVQELSLLTMPPTAHVPPVTSNCVTVVKVIVVITSGAVPELVRVKVLAVATLTAPYAYVPLPRLMVGATPVPLKLRLRTGAPPVMSVTVNFAAWLPTAVGVRVTPILQVAEAARVAPVQASVATI